MTYVFKLVILALSGIVIAGCGEFVKYSGGAPSSPTAVNLENFPKVDQLKHYTFNELLRRHVNTAGNKTTFDYDKVANNPEALYLLDQYLAILASTDPSGLKDNNQRLAYWLNAYNAGTLRAVLARYKGKPTYSVSEGGFNVFDTALYSFGGVQLSLNQIEHGILRSRTDHAAVKNATADTKARMKLWAGELWGDKPIDPRLHMAINCASASCPNIPPYAFSASKLDEQLKTLTTAFLADPAKGAGPNGISQLFTWFKDDFSKRYSGPEDFIKQHRANHADVDYSKRLTYDWSLNIYQTK